VLTFTALALAAFGALAFWFYRHRQKSTARKQRDKARTAAAALQAEQDRLDCLELERSLGSGPPTGKRS
jgi:hypothetical protein